MADMVTAFVGLGSNLGDSAGVLRAALASLGRLPRTRLVRASRLYLTPAWGLVGQPDFINAVAMLQTGLGARALLDHLLAVERAAGRVRRDDGADRWGPRTLDLDLLLYSDLVVDEPGLCIPHPHLHARAFALMPLVELAPQVEIPGRGAAAAALATMVTDGIQALP